MKCEDASKTFRFILSLSKITSINILWLAGGTLVNVRTEISGWFTLQCSLLVLCAQGLDLALIKSSVVCV